MRARIFNTFYLLVFLSVIVIYSGVFLCKIVFASGLEMRYRREILIDNTKNQNDLTDYQILVSLDVMPLILNRKMRPDLGDIRFTDSDGHTPLYYWIEDSNMISVSAFYNVESRCIRSMDNFPRTPKFYSNNDWYADDLWNCTFCDYYVRIYLNLSKGFESLFLEVRSREGHSVWVNGITLGREGGTCHREGEAFRIWNLTPHIKVGTNEIRIWCTNRNRDGICLFKLIVDGYEIRRNGEYNLTRIWVKVPKIPASSTKTIYLYYGNPHATSESNPWNTFDLYSDFQDGTLQGWIDAEKDTGSPGCVNDYPAPVIDTTTGNPSPSVRKGPKQGSGYNCEVGIARTISLPGNVNISIKLDSRAYSTYSGSIVTNAYIKVYRGTTITGTLLWSQTLVAGGTTDTGWRSYGPYVVPTIGETTVTIHLYTGDGWAADWDKTVWFDNIMVRKYSFPEPVIIIGKEELVSSTLTKGSGVYRIPIIINNTYPKRYYGKRVNLTDYQILIVIDTHSLISKGKLDPDCKNIIFTDSDGTTILPFYIYESEENYISLSYSWKIFGCNSTRTMIRVKVPHIPANSTKTIYMYYGNVSYARDNKPRNVFTNTSVIYTLPPRELRIESISLWPMFSLSCISYQDSIYCLSGERKLFRYNITSMNLTITDIRLPWREIVYGLSCVPYRDSFYCFGGETSPGRGLNKIIKYNITTNTISEMSTVLPSPRSHMSCVPYQDSVYCFGGLPFSDKIIKYNITTNTISEMSTVLPSPRSHMSCVPYQDSVYCFGGRDRKYTAIGEIVRYDIKNNSIKIVSTSNIKMPNPSCAPYDDFIYCFSDDKIIRYDVVYDRLNVFPLKPKLSGLPCIPYADSIYCLGYHDTSRRVVVIFRYGLNYFTIEPRVVLGEEEIV